MPRLLLLVACLHHAFPWQIAAILLLSPMVLYTRLRTAAGLLPATVRVLLVAAPCAFAYFWLRSMVAA